MLVVEDEDNLEELSVMKNEEETGSVGEGEGRHVINGSRSLLHNAMVPPTDLDLINGRSWSN